MLVLEWSDRRILNDVFIHLQIDAASNTDFLLFQSDTYQIRSVRKGSEEAGRITTKVPDRQKLGVKTIEKYSTSNSREVGNLKYLVEPAKFTT